MAIYNYTDNSLPLNNDGSAKFQLMDVTFHLFTTGAPPVGWSGKIQGISISKVQNTTIAKIQGV